MKYGKYESSFGGFSKAGNFSTLIEWKITRILINYYIYRMSDDRSSNFLNSFQLFFLCQIIISLIL